MRQNELTYQKIERVLTPEGYAVPDGEGWKRYVYVRDVQGNIRAVVGENNAVAEQTDYYPYGMPMADVNSASAQPFKFGGKELEREGGTDFYDFEARRLDFALGRFTSPDPLCEQTPEVSPYAYCAADPVNFIDPDGRRLWMLDSKGNIVDYSDKNKQYDMIAIVDKNKNVIRDAEGNEASIKFDYNTITNVRERVSVFVKQGDNKKQWYSMTMFQLKDSESGMKLFKFLSDNEPTKHIEWSLDVVGASEKGTTFVGTSHKEKKTHQGSYLLNNGYTIVKDVHNHPSSDVPSPKDKDVCYDIKQKFPNAIVQVYRPEEKVFEDVAPVKNEETK